MSKFFKDYHQAHAHARKLADLLGRDVGLSKSKEYTTSGYTVHHLPDAKNRYGFELRAQVVKPGTPRSDKEPRDEDVEL